MQLRHNPLIPLFIGFLLLAACKKDDQKAPSPPSIPKIRTVSSGNDLRTYTYDSKGRVTRIVYSLYGRDEYAYSGSTVTRKFYDLADTVASTMIYTLDANGRATGYTSPASTYDVITYSYNGDGQLSAYHITRTIVAEPVRNWDYAYHYTNRNLDSIVITYTDGGSPAVSYEYYDEYYTDKISTIGNDNYGQSFLGSGSKNPVKAARDIGHDSQGNYPQTTYQYEFDSLNRITKQLHYWGTSSFAPISFTYY